MRIFLFDILTIDGFFSAKFDILKPRWLPTAATPFGLTVSKALSRRVVAVRPVAE